MRYWTNVGPSNRSYVLKNYLPSFVIEPYAAILLWLPVYGMLMGWPTRRPVLAADYHVVHEKRLILH